MPIRTRRPMPDRLVLMDRDKNDPVNIAVEQNNEYLLIQIFSGNAIELDEVSARRLRGRIDKFLRDIV